MKDTNTKMISPTVSLVRKSNDPTRSLKLSCFSKGAQPTINRLPSVFVTSTGSSNLLYTTLASFASYLAFVTLRQFPP
jgi:hypothetical protein